DIMKKVLPAGPVFQAGTLSGNPLAMAAGIATLQELHDHPPYDKLERLSARLCAGLRGAAETAGATHHLNHASRMRTLLFTSAPVSDRCSAKKTDTQTFARFFWAMMDRGVYLPCSQFEAAFVSAAHTDQNIEETIAAAGQALSSL